jgi:type I restriction enzyme M protein
LQLWTESGGTSYGKLTLEQVRSLLVPVPRKPRRIASDARVKDWAAASKAFFSALNKVGSPEDRVAIVNSAIIGLADLD